MMTLYQQQSYDVGVPRSYSPLISKRKMGQGGTRLGRAVEHVELRRDRPVSDALRELG